METPDPELDTNRPVTTHRTMTGARLSQDGHMFSLAHTYIGPDPNFVATEPEVDEEAIIVPPVDDGKAGVLARATAKLEGFSSPEDNSDVAKENNKAQNAERLAG